MCIRIKIFTELITVLVTVVKREKQKRAINSRAEKHTAYLIPLSDNEAMYLFLFVDACSLNPYRQIRHQVVSCKQVRANKEQTQTEHKQILNYVIYIDYPLTLYFDKKRTVVCFFY